MAMTIAGQPESLKQVKCDSLWVLGDDYQVCVLGYLMPAAWALLLIY